MHTFRSIFKFEAREFLDKQNLIVFGLLLALALGMTQYGVYKFKQSLAQKKVFQQVEEKKVEYFFNYRIMGLHGFRLMLLPNPMGIFFINSVPVSDITALVDAVDRLNLYKSVKGEKLFGVTKDWFTDFSSITLFFGGLLGLLYGLIPFLYREHLRFLSSLINEGKLFWYVFLSRAILLSLLFFFVTACAVGLVLVNGILLPIDQYLLIFFLKIFLTTLFFFALGTVFSTCRKMIFGIAISLICWLASLLLVPTVLNIIIEMTAKKITPVYQLEIEKLKIVMDFERRTIEKEGILKNGDKVSDSVRKRMLDYWNNDFKKFLALEGKMIEQMSEIISLRQKLSSFFPTTFYLSVNNEISGSGYENLILFYKQVKKIKRDFFKYFMNKVYFSNYSKVEAFLKPGEAVFYARPRLPGFFSLGILITLLWIAGLMMISYYRFKRSMFQLPKKEKQPIEEKILELKSGEFKSWLTIGNLLNDQLYNLLSGQNKELMKKKYNLKVSINDIQLNTTRKKQNFFYLCHPSDLPGHPRVRAFVQLIMDLLHVPKEKRNEIIEKYHLEDFLKKRFSQLEIDEYGQVFLALLDMKTFDIYLINDITRAMFMDFAVKLDERMDQLCNDGALVLFLTTDAPLTVKKSKEGKYFYDYYSWRQKVRTWRDANENDE